LWNLVDIKKIQTIKLNVIFREEGYNGTSDKRNYNNYSQESSPERVRLGSGAKLQNPMFASAMSHKDSHKSMSEKGGTSNKDYKKDYEKLLAKVEEQEKLLVNV
jgi:hypothetical protein